MESESISVPDEVAEYVDEIVWVSSTTAGIPVLNRSEVYRALISVGFDRIQHGDVEIGEIDMREIIEESNQTFDAAIEAKEADATNAHCDSCGYAWRYTGDLDQATCPSCSKKVQID